MESIQQVYGGQLASFILTTLRQTIYSKKLPRVSQKSVLS